MADRVKAWLGGYARRTARGKVIYVIEKWAHGDRHHFSTGCNTEHGAIEVFRAWEKDHAYRPGTEEAGAVHLTKELATRYRAYQLKKGISREWVDEMTRCLGAWGRALEGRDLRHLDLFRDIKAELVKWPKRHPQRMKAIKGLFRWMRQEEGIVTRGQDATLDLRIPQSTPEKWRRRKVVPHEDVAAVLKKLPEVTRDVLLLQSATSWHVSEVRRFADGGEVVRPLERGGPLAVLVVRQKGGEFDKKAILHPEHLAAAERLRLRGCLPTRMTLSRHQRAACEAAGVPWFGMGQMRHSVLSWGVQRGASLGEASEFAHHKSKRTTDRLYVDLDIPTARIPILRLL